MDALHALRTLVVRGHQAEYLDVDVAPGPALLIRENGVHQLCAAVLTPGAASSDPHAGCVQGQRRICQQSSELQAAATALGRDAILLQTTETVATVVRWRRLSPAGPGPIEVVARIQYQLVVVSNDCDVKVDDGSVQDEFFVKPIMPSGPGGWAASVASFATLLPGGEPYLRDLIRHTGVNGTCLRISGLNAQLIVDPPSGVVRLLEPGQPTDFLPPTPFGRVRTDLRSFLGCVFLDPSCAISLQGEGVPGLDLRLLITEASHTFGPSAIVLRGPGGPVLQASLMLGYDSLPFGMSDEEFGIHIYMRGVLTDLFIKVPSMMACLSHPRQRRLLGVCTIAAPAGVPTPKPGFVLRDREYRPLQHKLDGWVKEYLDQQMAGLPEGPEVQSPESGRRVVKRPRLDGPHDRTQPAQQPQQPQQPAPVAVGTAGLQAAGSGGLRAAGSLGPNGRTQSMTPTSLNASLSFQDMPAAPDGGGINHHNQHNPFQAAQRGGSRVSGGPSTAQGPRAQLFVDKPARAARSATAVRERVLSNTWQGVMGDQLNKVMAHNRGRGVFNKPVDPVALAIPDYLEIVKLPMDFGTIKGWLDADAYTHYTQVVEHVLLVLDNCCTYNPRSNEFHVLGQHMEQLFLQQLEKVLPTLEMCAEQDPPGPPPARHDHLYGVEEREDWPPPNYVGVWPPVTAIRSTVTGLPLAAIRPYSPEGAAATLENVRKRIEAIFNRTRPLPLNVATTVAPQASSPMRQRSATLPAPSRSGGGGGGAGINVAGEVSRQKLLAAHMLAVRTAMPGAPPRAASLPAQPSAHQPQLQGGPPQPGPPPKPPPQQAPPHLAPSKVLPPPPPPPPPSAPLHAAAPSRQPAAAQAAKLQPAASQPRVIMLDGPAPAPFVQRRSPEDAGGAPGGAAQQQPSGGVPMLFLNDLPDLPSPFNGASGGHSTTLVGTHRVLDEFKSVSQMILAWIADGSATLPPHLTCHFRNVPEQVTIVHRVLHELERQLIQGRANGFIPTPPGVPVPTLPEVAALRQRVEELEREAQAQVAEHATALARQRDMYEGRIKRMQREAAQRDALITRLQRNLIPLLPPGAQLLSDGSIVSLPHASGRDASAGNGSGGAPLLGHTTVATAEDSDTDGGVVVQHVVSSKTTGGRSDANGATALAPPSAHTNLSVGDGKGGGSAGGSVDYLVSPTASSPGAAAAMGDELPPHGDAVACSEEGVPACLPGPDEAGRRGSEPVPYRDASWCQNNGGRGQVA